MPRRVNLPGASELFRTTQTGDTGATPRRPAEAPPAVESGRPVESGPAAESGWTGERAAGRGTPKPTGRVRHDEKITVYVSGDELLSLEQARIQLRAEHRLGVDRGRIVRAAIAGALADLAERGADSDLVRRLTDT
ncbi:hypothetical protein [Auraticoccus cholistanensis]|uniref:hypothetical protein n=1 Tax=Auraticoccus cholistanensis TaxID=2656650 RepID=UPI0012E85859|nr:hypothetical protein [Auraticoccus cholistanensis]